MAKRKKGEIISTIDELTRPKASRMEFEILANFYRICKKKGISEREVSFLLGKYNKYFIEKLNPFDNENIKTEYVDMLPSIASTSFKQIIPNSLKPKEKIDLTGTLAYYDDDQIETYRYNFTVRYEDGSTKDFRWKIETNKGARAKVNENLLDIVKSMVAEGYFTKPKFSLTIYLHMKKNHKSKFSPIEIQIALAKLCHKKADPNFALREDSKDARTVYEKA